MTADITHKLPKIIADHIAACNAHDIDAWIATFAPDALVNDIQREFVGLDAIRRFAAAEIFGTKVTMDVEQAWDRNGDVTVHARLDGTYDKKGLPDPLILSFYFTIRSGLITQLIIMHNKSRA
jgi:ketosteroid isomerase-like protein